MQFAVRLPNKNYLSNGRKDGAKHARSARPFNSREDALRVADTIPGAWVCVL